MKLLLDMNLSPLWVDFLAAAEVPAVHWSAVGDPRAPDSVLLGWALEQGYVVFTRDLDFSSILALTSARRPSLLQLRGQDILPAACGPAVLRLLEDHAEALESGALVTLDERGARVRVLPLRR